MRHEISTAGNHIDVTIRECLLRVLSARGDINALDTRLGYRRGFSGPYEVLRYHAHATKIMLGLLINIS
ncbi:MAG TPA: hypothetical protein PL173_13685 [Saprospiraceae bacterium]|nr:hypothetical protein [Saprospiraceae bacterium]